MNSRRDYLHYKIVTSQKCIILRDNYVNATNIICLTLKSTDYDSVKPIKWLELPKIGSNIIVRILLSTKEFIGLDDKKRSCIN